MDLNGHGDPWKLSHFTDCIKNLRIFPNLDVFSLQQILVTLSKASATFYLMSLGLILSTDSTSSTHFQKNRSCNAFFLVIGSFSSESKSSFKGSWRSSPERVPTKQLTTSAPDMLLKIAWSHYHRYSKNNPSFHYWSNRAHAHSHLPSCTRFAEEMECMIWATQNKYLRMPSMILPNLAKLSSLICYHQTFSMQLWSLGTFFDFITSRPMKHRLPMLSIRLNFGNSSTWKFHWTSGTSLLVYRI